MLYEIIGPRKIYDAIPMESVYYDTRTGVKRRVITTKKFQPKMKWDSCKTLYTAFKDIKETNLMEISYYEK